MQVVCTLDCADPDRSAAFWAAALGLDVGERHGPYGRLLDPDTGRLRMLLQRVPEPKTVKNRMHLDLRVAAMRPELDRLRALGATVLREPFDNEGPRVAVLADPEGNEFCVIVPEPILPGGDRDTPGGGP